MPTDRAGCLCTDEIIHVGCPIAGHGWRASREALACVDALVEAARRYARTQDILHDPHAEHTEYVQADRREDDEREAFIKAVRALAEVERRMEGRR